MAEQPLSGAVTLITGAGRGIGAAIARRFAAAGSDLVLAARSGEQLEALAAGLRASGREVLTVPADMTDPAVPDRLVAETMARFGRLDVLANNAGGAAPTPFLDTTPEQLSEAFHFNVAASFALTKCAVPHLLQSGHASVINVSSRMDRLVARGLLTYGTVKAAMSHMTRLLAAELAPRIRVNGLAPGVVSTEALDDALDEPTRRHILEATPLHRLAGVDDVANAALWLASPQAAYITGKIIELDGGAERPVFPDPSPDLTAGA
ncbi:MAG TPA: glucose 1-dehydrogenase [Solirubrobacteraceae bacterium]|jgi:7-alpha-hydroxysteroid dehydrogenase